MPKRTTLNISLTPELQQFLDEKLASGRYGSASEVVRDGLRLIQDRERTMAIEELRAKIDIGWQESERGEGTDGEIAFTRMRKQLVAKLAAQSSSRSSKRKSA